MLLSEWIKEIEKLKTKHGDLPVFITFEDEPDPEIEMFAIDDNGDSEHEYDCALAGSFIPVKILIR